MNKLLVFVMVSFLTAGCAKVTEYVATVIPSFKEEEKIQKTNPSLCPADKPTAQIVSGTCDGDWSHSYEASTKTYTCAYKQKTTVTCPAGSVAIGQPSACGNTIEQYTTQSVTSNSKCDELFQDQVRFSYRLVCCI